MARARNIKPGFFKNDLLVELPFEVRLLFVGLWTEADREGRLEDRPTKLKMALFPADSVDVNAGLQALHDAGFITRYESGGQRCIQVLAWTKHQNPHMRESASVLPPMYGAQNQFNGVPANEKTRQRIFDRDGRACVICGCLDDLHLDHVVPRVKGGGEDDSNLQTLCGPCNLTKGSKHSQGNNKAQPRKCEAEKLTGSAGLIPDSLIPDSLKELTEPNGSAADAALVDPIWGTGLAFLIRKRIPEKQARSLIGQLRKSAGDVETGAILAEAEAKDITDPAPWLMASASNAKARAGPNGKQPMGKQEQGLRALEAMKSGNRMAAGRTADGVPEALLLGSGTHPGG